MILVKDVIKLPANYSRLKKILRMRKREREKLDKYLGVEPIPPGKYKLTRG